MIGQSASGSFFTLSRSLYLGFSIILVIFASVTLYSVREIGFINAKLYEINEQNSVRQRYAINFRGSVHDRAIALRDYVLAEDSRELDDLDTLFKQLEDFYDDSHVKLAKLFEDSSIPQEERELYARINEVAEKTLPLIQKVKQLRRDDDYVKALELLKQQVAPLFVQWLGVINDFINLQERDNKLATQLVVDTADSFRGIVLSLTLIGIVLGLVTATLIFRRVNRVLGGEPTQAAAVVQAIAQGDLRGKVQFQHAGSMLSAVANMQEKLYHTFKQLLTDERRLSTGGAAVAQSSEMARQAAALQVELSRNSEEEISRIVGNIQEISEIAKRTENNSQRTSELSNQGSVLVNHAAKEMQNIATLVTESSRKISDLQSRTEEIGGIADVIREIAEQTNLLALNAAIEAARAGESGRGFAVVADEVRKLAERTSSATTEIATMIDTIQSETLSTVQAMQMAGPQVEKGLQLSTDASAMLGEINSQARESVSHAHSVTEAADQQVAVAQKVAQLMQEISSKANATHHAMQTNTTAVDELENISKSLLNLLQNYKI